MSRDFIELYDDDGYRYIVNMDKISFVNVAGRKVWAGEVATLAICDESMERLLPFGVQVYCPDNGGALRLTYDLRMQAAKSLREDSTLCLLWAMLMDSYSRWRPTGGLFIEASD